MNGYELESALRAALDRHNAQHDRPVVGIYMAREAAVRIGEAFAGKGAGRARRYRGIPVHCDSGIPLGLFALEYLQRDVYGTPAPDWREYVK